MALILLFQIFLLSATGGFFIANWYILSKKSTSPLRPIPVHLILFMPNLTKQVVEVKKVDIIGPPLGHVPGPKPDTQIIPQIKINDSFIYEKQDAILVIDKLLLVGFYHGEEHNQVRKQMVSYIEQDDLIG